MMLKLVLTTLIPNRVFVRVVIEMRYYVDYFDFFLGGRANRMIIDNKILRLKYDVLCINPQYDLFIFTITETLLEDSNRILIQYDDFWRNGIFKIAFSKKYKNAKTYIKDRLDILNSENETNFELDIYNSDIVYHFYDEYLEKELRLKGKNTYVIHRSSDADVNNRTLFRKRLYDLNEMYMGLGDILDYSTLNNLVNDLSDRSYDKTQIFQRGYIVKDIFLKYPNLYKKNSFIYNLFDQNYNDAMALSVNAVRLSKMVHKMNGVILGNFILCMDSDMYKKINFMSAHKIYILINNPSWQLFIEAINELYIYLLKINKIPKDYKIYKYFKKRVDLITNTHKCIIEIMDKVIGLLTIPEPYWKLSYEQLKFEIEKFGDIYLQQTNYIIWVAHKIFQQKKYIKFLIDDILKGE